MTINYFDSSLLLTILMNEPLSEEALDIWQSNKTRVSSILLRFEANIVLRRNYRSRMNDVSSDWLESRLHSLNNFLNDIFYIDVTQAFESSIYGNYDILSKCKSLDAIHIATALDIGGKYGRGEICVCSFDKNMLKTAREFGFETN